MRWYAVLVLLVGACGSRHPEAVVASGEAAQLPKGPPYLTPGERISYQLAIGGMNLATYTVGVGEVEAFGNHRAIVVQSQAKSQGFVSMVKYMDSTYTSWIDVDNGRPLRWTVEERTADGEVAEGVDAHLDQRTGNKFPVDVTLLGKPPVTELQQIDVPELWDYNALVIAFRAWEPKRGTTVTAEVLRSMYLWHVTVVVRGQETVVTEMGDFPALRLDAVSYRLMRDGKRDPGSVERHFSLWISNDEGRVPLQTIAETEYGDIKMSIIDYQPGHGNRLRP